MIIFYVYGCKFHFVALITISYVYSALLLER